MDKFNYLRKRYPSADGNLHFATTQTTATIKAAKSTSHTIYVQRIIVWIKTDAAQSLTFQDTSATPVVIAKIPTSPGADTRWDFDFGDKGVPLGAGKDLTATFSAAGLAGHITWYGYMKS